MNFKITAHLDGRGIYYDPAEPIHVDALLSFALARLHSAREISGRDDVPDFIPLPLVMGRINGIEVWRASAFAPEGATVETLRYWRSRLRTNRLHLTAGSPNTTNGIYRDYSQPLPLLLAPRMVAYASGSRKEVKRILERNIKFMGKKRAQGIGQVVGWGFDEMKEDWSWVKDGKAMRFLPTEGATRIVRPLPPYWCSHGAVPCCEVGDEVRGGLNE